MSNTTNEKAGIRIKAKIRKAQVSKAEQPTATAPSDVALDRVISNSGFVSLALARLISLSMKGHESCKGLDENARVIITTNDVTLESKGESLVLFSGWGKLSRVE